MAARQPLDPTCLLGRAAAGRWGWKRRVACARTAAGKQQPVGRGGKIPAVHKCRESLVVQLTAISHNAWEYTKPMTSAESM